MNDLITNGTEIKQRIISEINKASKCLYVAVAWFTDRDIANAIINAKNRAVIVDVILSSNVNNEEVIRMLKSAGISVHAFDTGDTRGLMHHKFCLFDNQISINGSFNFSYNASRNNVENIVVSDDTSLYEQFHTEFEQLKQDIDNQIALNTTYTIPMTKIAEVQPINIIDTFSQRLHNLVYLAAQIDTVKYKQQGYTNSKENKGNLDIFRTEYENIKDRIRTYATDESLGNTKNVLISNVSLAYESTKTNLETEKQEKLSVEKRNNEIEKRQINDKIYGIRQDILILESGNQNTGDKGLLQFNKDIEKNKIEKRNLEQTFVVKRFWSIGTVFVILLLTIFIFYLSIFFASAIYKVFFEGNVIRASLEAGVNPGLPQLIDANSIIKIFRQQGALFGLIASLFFIIPILMSNLKIIGSKNKYVNNILFWVGILIFDVLVSTMVAVNTDSIKSLLNGRESTLQIWEVVKHGEFWLIFVFGMFPLILTHYLIDNIYETYKNSQRDMVDAEKNKKIQLLDEDMLDLNLEKESLTNRINEKREEINQYNTKVINLETEINNRQTQVENRYAEFQNQIKVIFDDFIARIISGRIFTDVIFDSVISAYKLGFIEFLPEYYATDQVANRVREIELASKITI